jgi:hypothetical protein
MEAMYARCAGPDVHKKSVTACIRMQQGKNATTETAMFGTFTRDLERLRDWLTTHKVQQVAMESTGVFWIPVWNVLERAVDAKFELTLINPQHAHAIPGRKTDRLDCERLAELHQYGLLQGSFIPPVPVRELRDLTRRRAHLQHDRNRVVNRIARLLETVNIKLGSVVSDLTGKTSQLILAAVAKADCDPEELVKLAQASLKNKRALLIPSLEGFCTDHFRWLLSEALHDLALLDRKLEQIDRPKHCTRMRTWFFDCARFRDLSLRQQQRYWPRSASTCSAFRRPLTWRVGRDYARARTKVPAREPRRGHARATGTYVGY